MRQVSAIFCDDVRQETSGKLIFIGVYTGTLIVPKLPTTLSKLCVLLTTVAPVDRPFKKLKMKIYKGLDVISERAIPDEYLNPPELPLPPVDDEQLRTVMEPMRMFRTQFTLSPLELNDRTFLRVRVETEDEELKCPGLSILELSDVQAEDRPEAQS